MAKSKQSSDKKIRIGLADKSPLIQAALTHLLTEDERFELIEVCADGETFLNSIDGCDLDVAIIGWVISPGDGKYILDQLRSHEHAPRIVVYTGAEGESVPVQVMAHGAAAFVSKSDQPDYLLDTVAAVAEGRMVFPFLDVRKIHRNPLTTLTKRELEVLSALAAGQTNKEIATAQGISPNTVKFHIRNIFEKLGVQNRSQAIALYLKS
jgi:two-component system nitrate/nitrite response regulator NarP